MLSAAGGGGLAGKRGWRPAHGLSMDETAPPQCLALWQAPRWLHRALVLRMLVQQGTDVRRGNRPLKHSGTTTVRGHLTPSGTAVIVKGASGCWPARGDTGAPTQGGASAARLLPETAWGAPRSPTSTSHVTQRSTSEPLPKRTGRGGRNGRPTPMSTAALFTIVRRPSMDE